MDGTLFFCHSPQSIERNSYPNTLFHWIVFSRGLYLFECFFACKLFSLLSSFLNIIISNNLYLISLSKYLDYFRVYFFLHSSSLKMTRFQCLLLVQYYILIRLLFLLHVLLHLHQLCQLPFWLVDLTQLSSLKNHKRTIPIR